jgi:hypothetical protein
MSASEDVSCDILTWEPNNIEVFKERYVQRALAKFGNSGKILKFEKDLQFPPIPEAIPFNLSKEEKASRKQDIRAAKQDRKDEITEHSEKKIKLYGDLSQHISKMSKDKMELDRKAFYEADSKCDPLLLFLLCIKSHKLGCGLSDTAKKTTLLDELNSLSQVELNATVNAYIKTYLDAYNVVPVASRFPADLHRKFA